MTNRTILPALLFLPLHALGCADAHVPDGTEPPPSPLAVGTVAGAPGVIVPPDVVVPPAPTGLEACLLAGGALVEVDAVDNNDSADHGAIVTLDVSDDGLLAVAATDGTIKFWTLDTGLVGEASTGVLTYGPEVGGGVAADLQFEGEDAIVGDVRGLVAGVRPDGTVNVLGGGAPEIAMAAVAADAGWLAHADVQDGGTVMVRAMDGSATFGPLATDVLRVADVVFLPDGTLLLAGADADGRGRLEARGAAAPDTTVASHVAGESAFVEAAVAADGSRVAAVAGDRLVVLDGDLSAPRSPSGGAFAGSSVAMGPTGSVALTVGADGLLRAWSTGASVGALATASVAYPVRVRIDPTGTLAFVGTAGSMVHAYGCEPR